MVKVVCFGASPVFTHRVFRDFLLEKCLEPLEFVLVDTDPKMLKLELKVLESMVDDTGYKAKVSGTTNRKKVLRGADVVIISIGVATPQCHHKDIDACLKYGIGHGVGDTLGPATLSRALRTIPPVVEIARDVERLCPEAFLVNLTNPMSAVCLAINQHTSLKPIGLCHAGRATRTLIAGMYDVGEEDVFTLIAGVNHFIWLLEAWVKGKNRIREVNQIFLTASLDEKETRMQAKTEGRAGKALERVLGRFKEGYSVTRELMRTFGYRPLSGDKHIAEFFPFFYRKEMKYGKKYGLKSVDVPARMKSRKKMTKLLQKWAARKEPVWDLDKPSGEDVTSIVISKLFNKNESHQVNIPNNGIIANLPDEVIVEVPAVIGPFGYRGMSLGEIPRAIASMCARFNDIHHLTVQAAMECDREAAAQAIAIDPLVTDLSIVPAMLEDIIKANRGYISKKWEKKKK